MFLNPNPCNNSQNKVVKTDHESPRLVFYRQSVVVQNIFCWSFLLLFFFCVFLLEHHQGGCKILPVLCTKNNDSRPCMLFPILIPLSMLNCLPYPGVSYSSAHLRQISAPTGCRFYICSREESNFPDLDITIEFCATLHCPGEETTTI